MELIAPRPAITVSLRTVVALLMGTVAGCVKVPTVTAAMEEQGERPDQFRVIEEVIVARGLYEEAFGKRFRLGEEAMK